MPFPTFLTKTPAMRSPLNAAKTFLEQGMTNQQLRARVAAENLSHAYTTSSQPGGDPYRRKVLTFQTVMDQKKGLPLLRLEKIGFDASDFKLVHKPHDPAADERGYVKMPNVEPVVELLDFREANQATTMMAQIYALATTMENTNNDLLKNA